MRKPLSIFALLISAGIAFADDGDWISLFNGKDLEGWTPKFAGSPLGENLNDTYQVDEGILKVNFDKWKTFDMRFGHLYSNSSYSRYIVRVDFKILPYEPLADAPHWTARNSGIMIHAQSPLTLDLGQGFPVSLEGQFLAAGTTAGTSNGNVVTPGTHVVHDGQLTKNHIIKATAPLPELDQWVTFEAEVHGADLIIYRVDGEEVARFEKPILDAEDKDAKRLIEAGARLPVDHGHLALQAEGHPIWFRNIMIKPLSDT